MLLCLLLFWSMCCATPHSCILLFLVWICIKIICFDYTPSCALLAQHPWQNSRPTKGVILVAFFFLFCFVYPVQFLCLEQKDRSLEDHTRDFLDLACLTHFLDQSFCVFYVTSLSERCKARLPANGPKEEDFAALVESHFQTRDQPAVIPLHRATAWAHCRWRAWAIRNWASHRHRACASSTIWPSARAGNIVRPRGSFGGDWGLEGSPANTPATKGELHLVSGSFKEELMDIFKMDLIDWFGKVLTCAPESPASPLVPSSPESPASPLVLPSSCPPVSPPNLPLPPPLKPASSSPPYPLMPVSPSAHSQSAPAVCSDPPPQDFQSPAPHRHAYPLSPPPTSEPCTTLRSSDPSAPPWLLAPSSPPWPVIPLAPPGSLVQPAPPWSVVDHPPPRHSTPLALSGSSFPPAPPSSSVAPAPPWSSGSLLHLSQLSLQLCLGPPDPLFRPGSPSARLHLGLHLQRLSLHQSPPWCCRPLFHHGSSRRRLHRGSLSWLVSGSPSGLSCSGFSPAPSSIYFTLALWFMPLSYCLPLSCSTPTSWTPTLPPLLDFFFRRGDAPFREGAKCHVSVVSCFAPLDLVFLCSFIS